MARVKSSPAAVPAFALSSKFLEGLPPELQPPEPGSPRARILAAACDLFAAHGFDGTSTRAVSEAAGVNLAMIHYYFGSKDQLYERVIAQEFLTVIRSALHALAREKSPEAVIVNTPFRVVAAARQRPQWAMLLRREFADGAVRLKRAFDHLGGFGPSGLVSLFSQTYEQAAAAGRLKALPPDAVRECLMSLGFGYLFMQPLFELVFPRQRSVDDAWSEWEHAARSILMDGLCLNTATKGHRS